MSFEAPPPPRGKRDMQRDSEEAERKNPINMSDHDVTEESYNIAVQRNKNLSAFTKEQEARQTELFEESSNRIYEKTYGHRPTTTSQRRRQPITSSHFPHTTPERQPIEAEKQAERVRKFISILKEGK